MLTGLSEALGGLGGLFQALDWLATKRDALAVSSALFDAEGTKLRGDARIIVDRLDSVPTAAGKRVFFFRARCVNPGLVMVPFPVIPGIATDYALDNSGQPTAEWFRFTPSGLSQFKAGGEANLLCQFVVVAYDVDALMGMLQSSAR